MGDPIVAGGSSTSGVSGIWTGFKNIVTDWYDEATGEIAPSQLNHLIKGHTYGITFSVDTGTDTPFNEQDFIKNFDENTNGHFKTSSAKFTDNGDGSGSVYVTTLCIETCEPVTVAVLLGIGVLALYFLHATLTDVKDIGTSTGGSILYIAIGALILLYVWGRFTKSAPA